MQVITVLLLVIGRVAAIPSPRHGSTEPEPLVPAAITSFDANINGPSFDPWFSSRSASKAPAATHATTATKPSTVAERVVATSVTPPSATEHAPAAVTVATTRADATYPGATATPAGSVAAAMSTAATKAPQPTDDSTSKLGAVLRAAQVGGFPDRVTAAIAEGTCTQIEGGYKYTHSDDATFTTMAHRCNPDDELDYGDSPLPHSSCGLPVDAVNNGTLTNCVYPKVGGLQRQEWLFGPYTSTGGNDYWDHDVNPSSQPQLAELASRYPYYAGLGMTFWDADTGEQLGLPPIHGHHIEMVLGASVDPNNAWVREADGGDDMGYHDFYAHGYRLPKMEDFLMNILINDVREANSPPMRWYANVSFTYVDADVTSKHGRKVETLSKMFLDLAALKGTRFSNIEVPKDRETFFIVTGTWPASGTIVHVKSKPSVYGRNHSGTQADLTWTHTHAHLFDKAWLFAGTPEQLGLEDPTFGSATGCDAVPINNTRFASNAEMASYLEARCPTCFSLSYSRMNPDATTRLLCRLSAHMEEVDGLWYDREMDPDCYAESMRVVKGQPFTQLAFMDGGKPTMPGYHAMDWAAEGYGSLHLSWNMRYVDDESVKMNEVHLPLMLAENATFDEKRCFGDPEWLQYEYPNAKP